MPTGASLLMGLKLLIPLILSLTVHEWAHAYSAFRLGDDTAARQGRMTLNPIPHIDPIGTLLCPLLGVPFGWAKPVPVVPTRFRRDVSMRAGIMITAAAGPLSNLVLAFLCAVALGLIWRFGLHGVAVQSLLGMSMQLNLALFLFNLIPIPPLDGSRVADGLVPYGMRSTWDQITKYSWVLLLAVIILGAPLMAVPLGWMASQMSRISDAVAGF
jgi:Zn-dependent protease